MSSILTTNVSSEVNVSCRSVLFYAIPNGGPSAMVWGVSIHPESPLT